MKAERRRRPPRRPLHQWAARGALAAGVVAFGMTGARHTLGYALRGADPARALALSPADARLQALQALALTQSALPLPAAHAADRAEAARLARRALRRDPTAVAAVDALALLAAMEGHERQSRALFGYAMRLSRRSLPSQLWAIEDAVARGDIGSALIHYDIALRTSGQAPDLLFPVLAQAIADPAVRAALVTRMAARAPWGEAFMAHAADKGPDFAATAALLGALARRGMAPPPYVRASLIGRLVERGQYDAAWRYYASGAPGAVRQTSRDRLFAAAHTHPAAFDWTPLSSPGVSASLGSEGVRGALSFTAAPSTGGPLARQLQVLPAGRYTLAGRSAGIDQPPGSQPYWSLTCPDGREAGRVEVSASNRNGGRFAGQLMVPAGCPAQWLTLQARPSDNPQGLQGEIRDAQLRPE